jgi:hypothetical protein
MTEFVIKGCLDMLPEALIVIIGIIVVIGVLVMIQ